MAESLVWIAGDASTYTLYGTDTDRGIQSLEGIGLPMVVHTSQPYPFLHGALDIARRYGDRTVQLGFRQNFASRSAWQTGRQDLAKALNPDLGKGQLKFIDTDANDWRLDAWVVNAPIPRLAGWGPFEIRTVLEFWAPWPFWKPASAETDNGDFSGTSNVDITVSIDGNMPVVPDTITLASAAGEQITNPLLTIVGTGEKISLANTIAAGETVTITCWPPEDVAVTKDGTSIIGDLSYDSVLVGFEFARGSNTLRITGGDASDDGNCLVSFHEWYLAI